MKQRKGLFVVGVAVVVGAVLPPLDAASARHFPAHMLQHMVLVLVAAPLIAGSGVVAVRNRFLTSVLVVGVLHAAALWMWHLPALYDAAMGNDFLHVAEHGSFLVTGVLFWNVVFTGSLDRFKRIALVFVTMLQSGALGVVIAFASTPLYEWHRAHTPDGPLGSSRVLEEQQMAGAIMWVPPGVIYLAVMVALLAQALSAFEAAESS